VSPSTKKILSCGEAIFQRSHCIIDEESPRLPEMAIDKLGLSARDCSRIMKVSRTIADLEENEQLRASHVAEAIQYRNLDRRTI
jgi:magnesium chelatase family protein